MSWERHGGLREAITQLAAQIMYGEDVKQYFTAKRLAAKRLLGRASARGIRYRPRDLPSNGEIKAALLELVTEIEGDSRTRRLFAMRVAALEAIAELQPFAPRLIGSVATGHVREGSDIDVHVFAFDAEDVVSHVKRLGWTHEVLHVSIMKGGKPMEFVHVHVPDVFPIELTVYAPGELRVRPRSSTDGKPIVRIGYKALAALIERDHAEAWARYRETGAIPSLEDILAEDSDEPAESAAPWTEEDVEAFLAVSEEAASEEATLEQATLEQAIQDGDAEMAPCPLGYSPLEEREGPSRSAASKRRERRRRRRAEHRAYGDDEEGLSNHSSEIV